ncbi:hypothetical protein ACHAWF_002084 [Thalassiosira exigua]
MATTNRRGAAVNKVGSRALPSRGSSAAAVATAGSGSGKRAAKSPPAGARRVGGLGGGGGRQRRSSSRGNLPASSSSPSSSAAIVAGRGRRRSAGGDQAAVDEEVHTPGSTGGDVASADASAGVASATSYNGMGMGMGMGIGMGGMGMGGMGMGMYGMGGMGGMYGGHGYGMGGMGSQWLMSVNQLLFGVQSAVFSMVQAMHIVGMNAQQLKQLHASIRGAVESALGQVREKYGSVQASLEAMGARGEGAGQWMLGGDGGGEDQAMTQAEVIRRRRLAAFRWTMTLTASYLLYRGVRRLVRALIYGDGAVRRSGYQYRPPLPSDGYHGNGILGDYGYGASGYGNYGGASHYGSGNYYQRRGGYNPHSQGYGDPGFY